jgi:hypothetical protein
MTAAHVLAAYDPNDIKPGWIALIVVLALAIATYLLWRSMNTQLRRIDVPTKAELAEQQHGDEDSAEPSEEPSESENGAKP